MNGKPPTSALTPTPAADFKLLRQPQTVALVATGRVVTLKGVQLVRVLARGDVPDQLTPIVAALIWGAREPGEKQITIKDLALEYAELMDWVAGECLIYPRITATGEEADAIMITDLDPAEIQEIYDLATNPAKMLRPFRDGQAQNLGDVQHSQDELPRAE